MHTLYYKILISQIGLEGVKVFSFNKTFSGREYHTRCEKDCTYNRRLTNFRHVYIVFSYDNLLIVWLSVLSIWSRCTCTNETDFVS